MKLYRKDGRPVLDVTAIERSEDNLVCRAKVQGTMINVVVYVRLEEAWEIKKVIGKGVAWFLLKHMYRGWKIQRAARKTAAAT